MLKKFWKNEKGDTNIIAMIIVLAVVIAAVLLLKPYIAKFVTWICSFFM